MGADPSAHPGNRPDVPAGWSGPPEPQHPLRCFLLKHPRRNGRHMSTGEFEAKGEWWDPKRESHKVPGILTFRPQSGAELRLLGSLSGMFDEAEHTVTKGSGTTSVTKDTLSSGKYSRLHGNAEDGLSTLEDCFRTESTNTFRRGMGSETIRVNQVLKGALFEDGEALEATGTSFGILHLTDWIDQTGITEEWSWREDGGPLQGNEPRFKLEARDKPDQSIKTGNGNAVFLKHRLGISGDTMAARSLTQGFFWRVDVPNKVGLNDLIEVASDLQDLISIATNQTAAFEFVRFWHPDVFHQRSEAVRLPEGIDLFVRWNTQSDDVCRPESTSTICCSRLSILVESTVFVGGLT